MSNAIRLPPVRGKSNSLFKIVNFDDPNLSAISPSPVPDCSDSLSQEFGNDYDDDIFGHNSSTSIQRVTLPLVLAPLP